MDAEIIDIPLTEYCGCYLLYNDNELVYVGVSNNIYYRVSQHLMQGKKVFNKVKAIIEYDYLKAINIENYYIDYHKPKYNVGLSKLHYHKLTNLSTITPPNGWNQITP